MNRDTSEKPITPDRWCENYGLKDREYERSVYASVK